MQLDGRLVICSYNSFYPWAIRSKLIRLDGTYINLHYKIYNNDNELLSTITDISTRKIKALAPSLRPRIVRLWFGSDLSISSSTERKKKESSWYLKKIPRDVSPTQTSAVTCKKSLRLQGGIPTIGIPNLIGRTKKKKKKQKTIGHLKI